MTQRDPQNDDFMTVDANRRRLHLREVAGSAAGRYDGVGGELRAARMRNRLDLDAIGVKLRINAAYLLAIEEGRFSDLPGHVYVYGFLRSYAQYLGLDAEAVIQQYKTEAANPKPTAKLDFPSPMDRGRLPTLRILLLSIVLAGVVYGGWSMMTEDNRQTAERVAPLPERFANLGGPAAPAPATPAATTTPPVVTAPVPTSAAPAPTVVTAEPVPADPPPPAAAAPAEPAPTPALPALVAVTPTPTPAPPAPLPAPAPAAAVPVVAPTQAAAPAPTTPATVPPVAQPVPPVIPAPVAAAATPTPAATTPPAAPPMAVPAAPAAATPTPDDPRRRAGEGSPSANAPAALSATAPLPGQEGVARRLSTVTERPGISAVVPAAPPAPVPATAVTVPATAAAPADEPLADEDEDADAPPPPPTPRAAASPDAARGTGELTITSLPPSAAPSPSAPATAAPPVPAVPAPAGQSFGATAEPSRITVRADIDSWVQVTTTGGQPVFARMLRAGDQYLVPNRAGLRLMTGNGGGLRITVDGNPTPPIGTLGSVVRDVALEPERLLRGNATANETPGG